MLKLTGGAAAEGFELKPDQHELSRLNSKSAPTVSRAVTAGSFANTSGTCAISMAKVVVCRLRRSSSQPERRGFSRAHRSSFLTDAM
jgi:hypothetical protein